MEQFLFPDGVRLVSFIGMKNYIILGAEWSNSKAPFTHLTLIPSIYPPTPSQVSASLLPYLLPLSCLTRSVGCLFLDSLVWCSIYFHSWHPFTLADLLTKGI